MITAIQIPHKRSALSCYIEELKVASKCVGLVFTVTQSIAITKHVQTSNYILAETFNVVGVINAGSILYRSFYWRYCLDAAETRTKQTSTANSKNATLVPPFVSIVNIPKMTTVKNLFLRTFVDVQMAYLELASSCVKLFPGDKSELEKISSFWK